MFGWSKNSLSPDAAADALTTGYIAKRIKPMRCWHQVQSTMLRVEWNIYHRPNEIMGALETLELVREGPEYARDWMYDPSTTLYLSVYIALSTGQDHDRHCNIEVNVKPVGLIDELCQDKSHYWLSTDEKTAVINHIRKQTTSRIVAAREIIEDACDHMHETVLDIIIEDYFRGY